MRDCTDWWLLFVNPPGKESLRLNIRAYILTQRYRLTNTISGKLKFLYIYIFD